MSWRLAKSLTKLRTQINTAYPNRNKASDGTIGDTSHAATASDHNPNSKGVVTALDLTHDPSKGFDAHKLADLLIKNRHPNLEYVISNSRIAGAWTGWKWSKYTGSNPHSKHIHISVGDGRADGQAKGNYDSTQAWVIKENDMYKGKSAKQWATEATNLRKERDNWKKYYDTVLKKYNALLKAGNKSEEEVLDGFWAKLKAIVKRG